MDTQETAQHHEGGRISIDPTINIGNMLTMATMIVAGFVAWSQLDKRVVVLEQTVSFQPRLAAASAAATKEATLEMRKDVKDVKETVDEIRRTNSGIVSPRRP